jgi:hypothetical protein
VTQNNHTHVYPGMPGTNNSNTQTWTGNGARYGSPRMDSPPVYRGGK